MSVGSTQPEATALPLATWSAVTIRVSSGKTQAITWLPDCTARRHHGRHASWAVGDSSTSGLKATTCRGAEAWLPQPEPLFRL